MSSFCLLTRLIAFKQLSSNFVKQFSSNTHDLTSSNTQELTSSNKTTQFYYFGNVAILEFADISNEMIINNINNDKIQNIKTITS